MADQSPARPLGGIAWFAIGGIAVVAFCRLVLAIQLIDLHGAADPTRALALAHLRDVDDERATWEGIGLLAYVGTGGLFIWWFHTAYANLRRLGVRDLRWSDGWAAGAWLVPVLSLWRPKQIANDIWRAGEPGAETRTPLWRLGEVPAFVSWWWGLYLGAGFVLGIGAAMTSSGTRNLARALELGTAPATFQRRLETGTVVEVVGCLGLAAAAWLAVLYVSRTTARLEALREWAPSLGPVVVAAPLPDVPLQDLVRCPECAEFVAPAGSCSYCGYSFSSAAAKR